LTTHVALQRHIRCLCRYWSARAFHSEHLHDRRENTPGRESKLPPEAKIRVSALEAEQYFSALTIDPKRHAFNPAIWDETYGKLINEYNNVANSKSGIFRPSTQP